jgi:HD-GYP domain-containing protein (c-di-GMP phosphodiesterase class II)
LASETTPTQRPVLTLDDLAPLTRRPERLHALTASELAIAFSKALDLAEGKEVGHAQRVCYIATHLAEAMELAEPSRSGVFFAALLHDVGVTPASADLFRAAGVDEMTVFGPAPLAPREDSHRGASVFADREAIDDAVESHGPLGADIARKLELGEECARAIEHHHERWDGDGFPVGFTGDECPIEARIVAVADAVEVLISDEPSALIARKRLAQSIQDYAGSMLDPAIVGRFMELARLDDFWLGLYSEDLAQTVNGMRAHIEVKKSRKRVMRFAEVFAELADAKRGHKSAHAKLTSTHAESLALQVELDAATSEMIKIAALLLDLGLLGVPARIMSKPDILSVTEMQLMRQHPTNSEMILQDLPGLEEVAQWIARHHERPDGKGYPDMLDGDEIPVESRILAVADMWAALTSDRPHRAALTDKDARQVLLNAAGHQLDAELVRTFLAAQEQRLSA